jgi:hypothetical protein
MFKTIVIAALGFAAVSAQFLDERNLQANGTSNSTAAAAPAPLAATPFSIACSVGANGVETGCATGYCCANYTTTGTAPAAAVAKQVCVPHDFIGQSIVAPAGTTYSFRCINATAPVTPRTVCAADTECGASQCCATATLNSGTAAALTSATRRFCTSGAAANLYNATYTTTAAWNTNFVARVSTAACTPNPEATSFGAYIKASVMMVVAVLSVALF